MTKLTGIGSVLVIAFPFLGLKPLRAEEEKKAPSVRLSFSVPTGRPLLCVRAIKLDGDQTIISGKSEAKVKMAVEEENRFVDEHTVLDKDREEALRVFVSSTASVNGDTADPPLSGVEFACQRQGQETFVKVHNDRLLPTHLLEDQVRAFRSLGIWLQLPDEAGVGASFEVDLAPLAPLLLSGDLRAERASATMILESFDSATGIAVLKGKGSFLERGRLPDGLEAEASYELSGEIRVNPGDRRIISAGWKGSYRFEGHKAPLTMKGGGAYEANLRTEVGEEAKKARGEKPKFRDRKFGVSQVGVQVTLPSYYGEMPAEETQQRYVRTLEQGRGVAVVVFTAVLGDASKPAAFFDGVFADVKKGDPKAKRLKISSSLGSGLALFTTAKGDDGQVFTVRSELYPLGNRYLVYKLVASPKHFPIAEKEFASARGTLKPLESPSGKTAAAGKKESEGKSQGGKARSGGPKK